MTAESSKQIRHMHSVDAGHSGAERKGKTPFLNDYVKPIFDLLAEDDFESVPRAKGGRSPFGAEIADEILREITGTKEPKKVAGPNYSMLVKQVRKYWDENPKAHPDLTAFRANVRKWLKAREKSSQQKNSDRSLTAQQRTPMA